MSVENLARELLQLVRLSTHAQVEAAPLILEGDRYPLPDLPAELEHARHHGNSLVKELARALAAKEWRPRPGTWLATSRKGFAVGEMFQRAAIRRIRRGYIEPVRRLPILENVPVLVMHFLTQLPGGKDFIKSENHPGVGWHYHYLADRHTRSDVILAWDTRWIPSSAGLKAPQALRPLFQELHGEGHTHFRAKP